MSEAAMQGAQGFDSGAGDSNQWPTPPPELQPPLKEVLHTSTCFLSCKLNYMTVFWRGLCPYSTTEPIISNGESSCARLSNRIDSGWKLGLRPNQALFSGVGGHNMVGIIVLSVNATWIAPSFWVWTQEQQLSTWICLICSIKVKEVQLRRVRCSDSLVASLSQGFLPTISGEKKQLLNTKGKTQGMLGDYIFQPALEQLEDTAEMCAALLTLSAIVTPIRTSN